MIKFYTPPDKSFKYYIVGNVGCVRFNVDYFKDSMITQDKSYEVFFNTYAQSLRIHTIHWTEKGKNPVISQCWIGSLDLDDESLPDGSDYKSLIKKELQSIKFDGKVERLLNE